MKLRFVKVNPSGNTTALILDPLPREVHSQVAARAMQPESLAVDQVGFIEPATTDQAVARLQMMGGEFCGNAARAFGAWLAEQGYPGVNQTWPESKEPDSRKAVVPVEISGYRGVLGVEVELDSHGRATRARASMPDPLWVRDEGSSTWVGFEGIVHAIAWDTASSPEAVEELKSKVIAEIGDAEAVGVMFYQVSSSFMTPAVWVRAVNSLVWEGSCGSGTVAVAAALAHKEKRSIEQLKIKQPAGTIEVGIDWQGEPRAAWIGGLARVEAEGWVYL